MVLYSLSLIICQLAMCDKTFDGNTEKNSKVENALTDLGILASRVRIFPTAYKDAASLRVELMGCVLRKYKFLILTL